MLSAGALMGTLIPGAHRWKKPREPACGTRPPAAYLHPPPNLVRPHRGCRAVCYPGGHWRLVSLDDGELGPESSPADVLQLQGMALGPGWDAVGPGWDAMGPGERACSAT